MYLHIGKNCVIKDKVIVGIFNIEKIKNTQEYKNLCEYLEENKAITDISGTQENSFILTEEETVVKGYISNIGTSTIKKRSII